MFSLFIFSLHNAFRKKGVAILAIIGVGIGVSLMVFILASSAGANKVFTESFAQAAGQITISSENAPMGFGISGGEASLLPESYVKRIEKIAHIKSVSPRVMTVISSKSFKTADPFTIIVGVNPTRDKEANGPTTSIYEGRTFSGENEVIVGKVLEESSKIATDREIKIGDKIEIVIPSKKIGIPPKKINLNIVGKFETGNFLDDYYLFSSGETVRNISGIAEDEINSIVVKVDSIERVEEVDRAIKEEFENSRPPIQTLLNKDIFTNLENTLNTFTKFRFVISIFSGIAGGMCILIVMLISVIERKKEFGILKAVGWSNINIIISILVESLILSIIGVIFGLLIGELGIFISGYYLELLREYLLLSWQVVFLVLGFGVIVGIIGGVYPSWRASRVAPMETLRNE